MSMMQLLAVGSLYTPTAASSDGSVYLTATAIPSGLSDSKTMTISVWIKPDAGSDGANDIITSFYATSTQWRVRKTSANTINFLAKDTGGVEAINITSTSTVTSAAGWKHVLIVIDMDVKANTKIYVNGNSDTWTETTFVVGQTLNLTAGSGTWSVFALGNGTEIFTGSLSDLWIQDTKNDVLADYYLDGEPVDLGPNGTFPTGSQPVFYFSRNGSGDNWAVNGGTGGNMTVTGGALGSPTPP
jgi:hypothetical protein